MNLFIKAFLYLIIITLAGFLFAKVTDQEFGLVKEIAVSDEVHEYNTADNDNDEKIQIVDGYKAIKVDEVIINTSGIKFEQLSGMSFKPEFTAYAEVMNIAPLVSLRSEYLNLRAEKSILQNDVNNHHKILKRAEALNKTKSLTTRELENIRADYAVKVSRLNAMETRLQGFVYNLKSNWGDKISQLLLEENHRSDFDKLASHEASLISISLLKNQTLANPQQKVYVSSKNQRSTAIQVHFFDQAKQASNPLYGESYIYLLESQKLSSGIRLFAWIEQQGEPMRGFFVPDSAVIWYANKPWIYTRYEDDLFVRKPLGVARKLTNGWLLQEPFANNAWVVTSGSQTLLSEEFKWAIPDEDDD